MAKCDSKGFVIRLDQVAKLKSDDLIAISILDDLASCAKINAANINTNNGANVVNLKDGHFFNAANVPEDEFGCSKNKCRNTGTYQGDVAAAATDVIIGDFKKTMDATLYATGLVTAYVMLPEGDHKVTLEIASYTAAGWTDYDKIEKTIHATKGNVLYPVVFDLTDVAGEEGNGWVLNQIGVKLRVRIAGDNLKADDTVGISSLAFYESEEDLEVNKTVLVSCIDTWGDSQSFDVIEGACSTSEYDPNSGTMTASITANKISEGERYLNPTLRKSEDAEFGILNIVTRKVQAGTGELAGYGVLQVSDIIEGDCGFMYIQTPGCANNSSELTRVSAPVPVINPVTDSTKFQVLTSSYNGDESLGQILVGKDWIGQELNIIYRKKVEAEVYEVTNEFREFTVNILAPLRKKDGTTEFHYYENAFLTTKANNISRSDETNFELQFTIAADENGVRKRIAKITEN